MPQFAIRDDVKTPTVVFGEESRDREFSLNVRLVQLVERFDLDQASDAARHANQKVRHNVRAPPRSSRPSQVVLCQEPNLRS